MNSRSFTSLVAKSMGAALLFCVAAMFVQPARATVTVTVSGNTAHAVIGLPGILSTDMTLVFDHPVNLTPANLNITANLVNPNDPALLARLPNPTALSLPAAFPVMISVSPPAKSVPQGGLSFVNAVSVEIHTQALMFTLDNLFRFYKAPAGGTFYDITGDVASGSVRTRGKTGGFSDFLILVDLIPNTSKASDQYDYISTRLNNTAIAATARNTLQADLAASRSAYTAGNYSLAQSRMHTFDSDLAIYAGTGVPNRWNATRDLDNIAGDLYGESGALQYTLGRLAAGY